MGLYFSPPLSLLRFLSELLCATPAPFLIQCPFICRTFPRHTSFLLRMQRAQFIYRQLLPYSDHRRGIQRRTLSRTDKIWAQSSLSVRAANVRKYVRVSNEHNKKIYSWMEIPFLFDIRFGSGLQRPIFLSAFFYG